MVEYLHTELQNGLLHCSRLQSSFFGTYCFIFVQTIFVEYSLILNQLISIRKDFTLSVYICHFLLAGKLLFHIFQRQKHCQVTRNVYLKPQYYSPSFLLFFLLRDSLDTVCLKEPFVDNYVQQQKLAE